MKKFFKENLAIILLVAAVTFGMLQWHRAELTAAINEQMWKARRENIKLEQTQNILSQIQLNNEMVADAFRQVGYQIIEPKPVKKDTAKAVTAKH